LIEFPVGEEKEGEKARRVGVERCSMGSMGMIREQT
jgi:hypothetical protein